MQESILSQGFDLLLYGMATVFIFLTILVAVTTLMSAILLRLAPQKNSPPQPKFATTPPVTGAVDAQLTAVITAAVHQYRNKKR